MASGKSPSPLPARRGTLFLTNAIKVAGVVLALKSGFADQRPVTLAVAAFMMAGAQLSENVLLHLIDRFFGER